MDWRPADDHGNPTPTRRDPRNAEPQTITAVAIFENGMGAVYTVYDDESRAMSAEEQDDGNDFLSQVQAELIRRGHDAPAWPSDRDDAGPVWSAAEMIGGLLERLRTVEENSRIINGAYDLCSGERSYLLAKLEQCQQDCQEAHATADEYALEVDALSSEIGQTNRVAQTSTVESFLTLSDDKKRRAIAKLLLESSRRKAVERELELRDKDAERWRAIKKSGRGTLRNLEVCDIRDRESVIDCEVRLQRKKEASNER